MKVGRLASPSPLRYWFKVVSVTVPSLAADAESATNWGVAGNDCDVQKGRAGRQDRRHHRQGGSRAAQRPRQGRSLLCARSRSHATASDWPNTFVARSKAGNLLIFQRRGTSIVPLRLSLPGSGQRPLAAVQASKPRSAMSALRRLRPSVASGRALLEYPVACLPGSLSPQHSRYATHRRHVFDPVAGGDVRRGE